MQRKDKCKVEKREGDGKGENWEEYKMGKSGWRSQEEKIRAGIMKMEARHVLNINPWREGGRGGVKGGMGD